MVGHAFRHASERAEPAQASAPNEEEVSLAGRNCERLDRPSIDHFCGRTSAPNPVEVDVLPLGRGDHPQRNAETRGDVLGRAEGGLRTVRPVDSDDDRGRKLPAPGRWTRDEDGAGGDVEQLTRHAADQDLGHTVVTVRPDRHQRRVRTLSFAQQCRSDEPVDEERSGLTADQSHSLLKGLVGVRLELVGDTARAIAGPRGFGDVNDCNHVDRGLYVGQAGGLAARLESWLAPVDADENAPEHVPSRPERGLAFVVGVACHFFHGNARLTLSARKRRGERDRRCGGRTAWS